MSKIYQALKRAESEKRRGTSEEEVASAHALAALGAPSSGENEPGPLSPLPAPPFDRCLVSLLEPKSLAAEQFRKLRSHLWRLEQEVRTLMVTSPLPQEGKTFVAANLAIALAQGIREHVLLVDCDFRRPSLHTLFGLRPQGGLANYLAGEGELARYLLKTAVPKLTLLPLGAVPPNPSELLASREMRELVREIRDRYPDRYVLFDATPVLPTTEPHILATRVDGVILVVRAARTPGPAIAKAIEGLNCANLLGIVFNGVEKVLPKSYAQYPYYYGENGNGTKPSS